MNELKALLMLIKPRFPIVRSHEELRILSVLEKIFNVEVYALTAEGRSLAETEQAFISMLYVGIAAPLETICR